MDVTLVLTEVPTGPDTLIMTGDFPTLSSEAMFDYWVKPELLTQWWPEQAATDPHLDGEYHLAWPGMNWHLRGHYTAFEPGRKLSFTWKWDHEPDTPDRHVAITFHSLAGGGTRLTIIHGPYAAAPAAQQDRKGHVEGWQHFCACLRDLAGDSL